MTGAWMLSTVIASVLLACTAWALSHVAALYRGVAMRWCWAAAMAASVAFALWWLLPAPLSPAPTHAVTSSPAQSAKSIAVSAPAQRAAGPAESHIAVPQLTMPSLPRVPVAVEHVILRAWVIGSAGLLVALLIAVGKLAAEKRQWLWRDVANTRVMISRGFGPAIVGVRKPVIVLPEWVLATNESAQRAIVAHEAEHRSAHDPALLLAGLAAVVLMPWNIGLWMSWRGLRRSIELDCDARVTGRGIDSAEYARVLLGAWKLARGSWLPSAAFAERASGLGARVEHLMRPEPRRRVMKTALGVASAAVLVGVACTSTSPYRDGPSIAPHPLIIIDGVKRTDLPPMTRFTGPVAVETTTAPRLRISYVGARVVDTAALKLYPARDKVAQQWFVSAPASEAQFGPEAKAGALVMFTTSFRDAGKPIVAPPEGIRAETPPPPPVTAFDQLFAGIRLGAREASALDIIAAFKPLNDDISGPVLAVYRRRNVLFDQRTEKLRALLATDDERARFDASTSARRREYHMLESESEFVEVSLPTFSHEVTLDAAELARFREILARSLHEEMATWERTPDAYPQARIAIWDKRDAELRAVIRSDVERAQFNERMKAWRDSRTRQR